MTVVNHLIYASSVILVDPISLFAMTSSQNESGHVDCVALHVIGRRCKGTTPAVECRTILTVSSVAGGLVWRSSCEAVIDTCVVTTFGLLVFSAMSFQVFMISDSTFHSPAL